MELLEFLSSLISSVVWPGTVLLLALTFRGKLKEVIGSIAKRIEDMTEASGPAGINAKFGKGVEAVTEVTSKLDAKTSPGDESGSEEGASSGPGTSNPDNPWPGSGLGTDVTAMAYLSPRQAVLEAFIPMEKAAYDLIEKAGGNRKDLQMMLRNPVAALRRSGLVSPALASSAEKLRKLRNQAAHQETFDVEPDLVLEYISATQAVTRVLTYTASFPSNSVDANNS